MPMNQINELRKQNIRLRMIVAAIYRTLHPKASYEEFCESYAVLTRDLINEGLEALDPAAREWAAKFAMEEIKK